MQGLEWRVDELYKDFMAYKFSVPVAGLILLNPKLDKCVMVKGYKSGSAWGFPKVGVGASAS